MEAIRLIEFCFSRVNMCSLIVHCVNNQSIGTDEMRSNIRN